MSEFGEVSTSITAWNAQMNYQPQDIIWYIDGKITLG